MFDLWLRDIRAGEELTINYAGPILTWVPVDIRRGILRNSLVSNATACDAKMRRNVAGENPRVETIDGRCFHGVQRNWIRKLFDLNTGELT